jgi:hypothetical protein
MKKYIIIATHEGKIIHFVILNLLFLQKPAYTINMKHRLNVLTDRLRGTVNYA